VEFKFDGQRLIPGRGHGPSHPPLPIWGSPAGPNGDGWVHGVGIWSELDGHRATLRHSGLQGYDRLLTFFVIQDVLEGGKKRQDRLERSGGGFVESADDETKPWL